MKLKPGPKPDTQKDKEVLMLKHEGLSIREIAKKMGYSKSTIHNRYQRAVRHLSTV